MMPYQTTWIFCSQEESQNTGLVFISSVHLLGEQGRTGDTIFLSGLAKPIRMRAREAKRELE